jgi:hypothetical protein
MQKEAAEQEAEQEAALEAEQEAAEANPPNVRGPRDRARTEAERLRRLDHPRAASRGIPFRVSRTQRRDQQAELRLDRDTEAALRCSLSSSPGKTLNVVLWAAPAHPASPTPARSVPATGDVLWGAVEESWSVPPAPPTRPTRSPPAPPTRPARSVQRAATARGVPGFGVPGDPVWKARRAWHSRKSRAKKRREKEAREENEEKRMKRE